MTRTLLAGIGAVLLAACGSTPDSPTAPRAPTVPLVESSPRFTLHYTLLDAASVSDIMATLEREHGRITANLDVTDMPPVTVNLYATQDAFRSAVLPLIGPVPSFATGAVSGVNAIHIVSPNVSAAWSYRNGVTALVHEFAHCVSLRINPTFGNNPRWLWEAIALYEAGQFTDRRSVATQLERTPPTFAVLNSFDNTMIYDVGAHLGDFIVNTGGRATLTALIRSNGNVTQVLGLTESQFLTRWIAWGQAP